MASYRVPCHAGNAKKLRFDGGVGRTFSRIPPVAAFARGHGARRGEKFSLQGDFQNDGIRCADELRALRSVVEDYALNRNQA